jgi:iron complex transport system ATP-binding protein
MVDLRFDQLAAEIGGRAILHPLDVEISGGQIIAVMGANGAGKSTLLRAVAGLIPITGSMMLDTVRLHRLAPDARARHVGYLPQQHDFAWSMPVRDMVALGLFAFGIQSSEAATRVDRVLNRLGISALSDAPIDRLSGGERALAAFARVLIAETPLLLLDEPAAALDIGRQYQLLDLVAEEAAAGRTIIIVLHDLALAAQYAQRILWLDHGKLVAFSGVTIEEVTAQAEALLGRKPSWSGNNSLTSAIPYFQR